MKLRTGMWSAALMAENGKTKSRYGNAAFTIVEVIVAAVIAAIAFTGIFIAISSGNVVIQNTRENLRASQIIESRMEGLRLIGWGNATNQLFNNICFPTNFTETFYPPGLSEGATNQGVVYYGSVNFQTPVTNMNCTYNTQMCLVTVSLQWTNSHYGVFNAHERTMSTYVAQWGMQGYVYYPTNN